MNNERACAAHQPGSPLCWVHEQAFERCNAVLRARLAAAQALIGAIEAVVKTTVIGEEPIHIVRRLKRVLESAHD